MDGHWTAVNEALQFAVYIHPGAAAAPAAHLDDAALGAQETFDDPCLVTFPLSRQIFLRVMALAAVGAGERHGGPITRPGGGTDQGGLRVEGEEEAAMIVRQQALPEGGGEAQPRPAEDRGDPGQCLYENASGDHGFLPGCPYENPVNLAAGTCRPTNIVGYGTPGDSFFPLTVRKLRIV